MENKVVLDFSRFDYSDAASYDEQNLIHRSKMEQAMEIWNQLYNKVVEGGNASKFHRYHNTISVFASRGAGKTSFLLSFLERIKKEKKEEILCLDPIDPSLIENKQHPFVNILAAIQERVERALGEDRYFVRDKCFEERKAHEDCYYKLLMALPFMDGIGKDDVYGQWDDEEFISIQGMKKVRAFNNLERTFHEYIKESLKLLDKKCIVIPFDDIDTDFKKGFEILEVIRRYITSGQIITVLTGDLELYSKLVRKAMWKCFNEEFLRKETEYVEHRKDEFAEMIDQLENQYLIKLLKSEYRIHLKTIREYLEEEEYSLEVIFADRKKPKAISKCYSDLLNQIGISSGNERINTELCHFLLGLSLRGQVRILTLLNSATTRKVKKYVTTGLLNIFVNDINQKASNAKLLINGTPVYTIEMLKFLIHANALYAGCSFLPETNDDVLNKALFAIGTHFNLQVRQNPFLIFDYWLRLSYVEVLGERLGGKLSERNVVKDLLDFSQLTANTDLLRSIGLAQAFCNGKLNRNTNVEEGTETMAGTIFIGNNAPVFLSESNQVLSMLPMLGTIDSRRNENVFLSVYRLFAVIREILFYSKNNVSGSLENRLLKEAPYSNFLQPFFLGIEKRREDFSDWNDVTIDIKEDEVWRIVIQKLNKWTEANFDVSASLLYRIFTRFYNTMLQIDEDDKYRSAGMKFNAYVVALLNAALVEEMTEFGVSNMNFNVIGDIETIYIHNRKMVAVSDVAVNDKFYKWLSACPLLEIFLHPFLRYLIQNDEKDKEQYLSELLRYSQMSNRLPSLRRKLKKLNLNLKKYNSAQEWIRNFVRYKEVEQKISDYQSRMYLLDDDRAEFEELQKERKDLRKKIRTVIKMDEADVLLHDDMDEMQVDFVKEDIATKMSEVRLHLKELFSEINQLQLQMKNVADFVKTNYETLVRSDSSVFDILNAIYI